MNFENSILIRPNILLEMNDVTLDDKKSLLGDPSSDNETDELKDVKVETKSKKHAPRCCSCGCFCGYVLYLISTLMIITGITTTFVMGALNSWYGMVPYTPLWIYIIIGSLVGIRLLLVGLPVNNLFPDVNNKTVVKVTQRIVCIFIAVTAILWALGLILVISLIRAPIEETTESPFEYLLKRRGGVEGSGQTKIVDVYTPFTTMASMALISIGTWIYVIGQVIEYVTSPAGVYQSKVQSIDIINT